MRGKIESLGVMLAIAVLLSGCESCRKQKTPAVPTPAATATAGKAASVQKLLIWADVDENMGDAPLTVQLTVDPLEDIDHPTYTWDFDDGSPETHEQNPKHTYQKPGEYNPRVKVTDPAGNRGEDTVKVIVDVPEPTPKPEAPKEESPEAQAPEGQAPEGHATPTQGEKGEATKT